MEFKRIDINKLTERIYSDGKHRIIIGTVAGVLTATIVSCLMMNYHKQSNYFNQQVIINGVKVGGLSKEEAYRKVKNNSHQLILENSRIVNGDAKGYEITKKDMANFFSDQQSFLPSKNKFVFKTEEYKADYRKLNELNSKQVTYHMLSQDNTFSPSDVFSKIVYRNGKYKFITGKKTNEAFNKVNEATTLDKEYSVDLPEIGNQTIKNETYGFGIDKQAFVNSMKNAFTSGKDSVDAKNDLIGRGFNKNGTGYTDINTGIGDNYVLVSLGKQKLWVVKDNKIVATLNDVVSGSTEIGTDNATPTGVYYIMYKQSPSVLKGTNDDGTKYASKVKYWMPITERGVGLHDADWRTDWSKNAYKKNGSHGCVNLKPSEAKSVWDNVDVNEPVIIVD